MLPNEASDALSPKEKRKSDRKKLVIEVTFEGKSITGMANTRDIGIGGLYVTTDAELETGDEIAMKMSFDGTAFDVKGIVAYVDKGLGVGVRFKDLTMEDISLLKRELEMD